MAGRAVRLAASTDGSRYLGWRPGVTGLLVPAHDPGQLAGALIELLEHPELAEAQMGVAGHERATLPL